jgi:hypothetical protein
MQPLDNPVAMFPEGPNLDAQRLLVCTAVHGYTVGCYPYYRLLMRKEILKTYPPSSVTSPAAQGISLPSLLSLNFVNRAPAHISRALARLVCTATEKTRLLTR